jgi:hypothetical protein
MVPVEALTNNSLGRAALLTTFDHAQTVVHGSSMSHTTTVLDRLIQYSLLVARAPHMACPPPCVRYELLNLVSRTWIWSFYKGLKPSVPKS